ncbi:MAG TPA: EF-Tu/IF-2/RF-3 family GTPase [Thermoplasmata archaeon]|nr:EF-Tu/IF-2/RF-3 family GTPase [Thermoplasmata archaeon]
MTTGVTVSVVGSTEVAKELGKKGTTSDVNLYNAVRDEHAVTLVEPTQFPEKFPALVTALSMGDRCLLVIPELNRAIAEAIATVDVVDVPTTIVLGRAVGEEELARALKGSRLERADRRPLDLPQLRDLVDGWTAPVVDGPTSVPIDHAFPVKGVGTVALGVVRRGTLRAHDNLRLWPTDKTVEVRSIQVHDIDRKDAGCGERVGVALRGIEADEISRGQVLAPADSLRAGATIRGGPLVKCRYYRGDIRAGAQLYLMVGLQSAPASLDEVSAGSTTMTADRPLAYAPGMPACVLDLSVPSGPRIVGRFAIGT